MRLYLVHHGPAVGPDVDPRRPLSNSGRFAVDMVAQRAAALGARPAVVWHSGKLRAKQTAESFWRVCNPFAEFAAVRDLQPDDRPLRIRERLSGEGRDVMLVGHFPFMPRLLALLLTGSAEANADFPPHGIVALESAPEGSWIERWRLPG